MKRRRLVPACLGLAAVVGCGDPIAPFDGVYDFRAEVESGDSVWSAVVHVPRAYDGSRAFPLVLVFHGWGGSGAEMQRATGLDAIADSLSFIVAYPDGDRGWDENPERDRQVTRDLIDHLAGRLGIARQRIYATGFSAGGWFTLRLACDEAGLFAAVGIVGATMYETLAAQCRPSERITTALVVGTADHLVPIDGSFGRLSADSTIALFAGWNGCALSGREVAYEPGGRVRREAYGGCRDGTETVLWVVEGGGHEWYRGETDIGVLLAGLFLRHRR